MMFDNGWRIIVIFIGYLSDVGDLKVWCFFFLYGFEIVKLIVWLFVMEVDN